MGLLDLVQKPGEPPKNLFPGDTDAMQVIKVAGEKAQVLMKRIGELFDCPGAPVGQSDDDAVRCAFCDSDLNSATPHLMSCKWQLANDAYDDVVKHAGQFMSGK